MVPEGSKQFLVDLASHHGSPSLPSVNKVEPLPFQIWPPQPHSRGCPKITSELLRKPAMVESWKIGFEDIRLLAQVHVGAEASRAAP